MSVVSALVIVLAAVVAVGWAAFVVGTTGGLTAAASGTVAWLETAAEAWGDYKLTHNFILDFIIKILSQVVLS